MNRFYCTVCKKVKRVQHYPDNVVNRESTYPEQRVGQCRRHELDTRRVILRDRKVG